MKKLPLAKSQLNNNAPLDMYFQRKCSSCCVFANSQPFNHSACKRTWIKVKFCHPSPLNLHQASPYRFYSNVFIRERWTSEELSVFCLLGIAWHIFVFSSLRWITCEECFARKQRRMSTIQMWYVVQYNAMKNEIIPKMDPCDEETNAVRVCIMHIYSFIHIHK